MQIINNCLYIIWAFDNKFKYKYLKLRINNNNTIFGGYKQTMCKRIIK